MGDQQTNYAQFMQGLHDPMRFRDVSASITGDIDTNTKNDEYIENLREHVFPTYQASIKIPFIALLSMTLDVTKAWEYLIANPQDPDTFKQTLMGMQLTIARLHQRLLIQYLYYLKSISRSEGPSTPVELNDMGNLSALMRISCNSDGMTVFELTETTPGVARDIDFTALTDQPGEKTDLLNRLLVAFAAMRTVMMSAATPEKPAIKFSEIVWDIKTYPLKDQTGGKRRQVKAKAKAKAKAKPAPETNVRSKGKKGQGRAGPPREVKT